MNCLNTMRTLFSFLYFISFKSTFKCFVTYNYSFSKFYYFLDNLIILFTIKNNISPITKKLITRETKRPTFSVTAPSS